MYNLYVSSSVKHFKSCNMQLVEPRPPEPRPPEPHPQSILKKQSIWSGYINNEFVGSPERVTLMLGIWWTAHVYVRFDSRCDRWSQCCQSYIRESCINLTALVAVRAVSSEHYTWYLYQFDSSCVRSIWELLWSLEQCRQSSLRDDYINLTALVVVGAVLSELCMS